MIEVTYPKISMEDFIGQQQAKRIINIMLNEVDNDKLLPHLLLIGDSGKGKTTFAKAIYHTTSQRVNNLQFVVSPTGRSLFDGNTLKNQLARAGKFPTIYFFDEAHYMKPELQEILYEPMDSGTISLSQRGIPFKAKLPPITIIAATTEPGKILQPFQSRFVHITFETYSNDEIINIINTHQLKGGAFTEDGTIALALRCQNNPRKTYQNVRKVISWCNQRNINTITEEVIDYAMNDWGINKLGLTSLDMCYLEYLLHAIQPQGINNIASILATDTKYLESMVEPYLLSQGFLLKTRAGRTLTPQGVQAITELIQNDIT